MKRLPVLGDLEAEVMKIAWSTSPVSVKDVMCRLSRERAYNTVQTTLDRLYGKLLLVREKQSHAFIYTPRLTRAEYHRMLLVSVVGELLPRDHEPVLAALVEMAGDADLKNLERLEHLIQARRQAERTRR